MNNFITKFTFTFTSLLIASSSLIAQDSPVEATLKLGPNPIFYIDSVRVTKADLQMFDPESIASVSMIYDSTAVKDFGPQALDGVVVIETREYARRKFIRFLRGISAKYDSLYTALGNDSSFCYIINDKVQKDSYEGNLSLLDKKLFIVLEILTPGELKQRFEIKNRKYGILIRSNKPENLYRKEEKF